MEDDSDVDSGDEIFGVRAESFYMPSTPSERDIYLYAMPIGSVNGKR